MPRPGLFKVQDSRQTPHARPLLKNDVMTVQIIMAQTGVADIHEQMAVPFQNREKKIAQSFSLNDAGGSFL
jgi:hypothetical protein